MLTKKQAQQAYINYMHELIPGLITYIECLEQEKTVIGKKLADSRIGTRFEAQRVTLVNYAIVLMQQLQSAVDPSRLLRSFLRAPQSMPRLG